MYFAHIHRIPTNPSGYTHLQTQQLSTFLLFFLVTQLQFVFLMFSQVWKVLLEVANLTHLLFMPECYFFIFYRYFEVNYILCELMSTVDLSCPGSTSSEWSSLISGTYNLSILSSVIVDLRAVVKPCTLLAQLHSAFDQLWVSVLIAPLHEDLLWWGKNWAGL